MAETENNGVFGDVTPLIDGGEGTPFEQIMNGDLLNSEYLTDDQHWSLQDLARDSRFLQHASDSVQGMLNVGNAFCELPEISNMTELQARNIQEGANAYIAKVEEATKGFARVLSRNLTITPETVESLAETPKGRIVIGTILGSGDLANSIIDNTDLVGEVGAAALNKGLAEFAKDPVVTSQLTLTGVCDKIAEATEQFNRASENAKDELVDRAENIITTGARPENDGPNTHSR